MGEFEELRMDRAAISRALANAHSPYISLSFIDESLERHVFLANLGSRKWIVRP